MQESFELNHETLYLSVKLWDLYMAQTSETQLSDVNGQLIASVCIFVASKFDERSPPLIDDFLYICQDKFEREEFIAYEMKVGGSVFIDFNFFSSFWMLLGLILDAPFRTSICVVWLGYHWYRWFSFIYWEKVSWE